MAKFVGTVAKITHVAAIIALLAVKSGIHEDMLNFAARTGVRPVIEKFEFTQKGFEEAMEKMKNGKMRYRGVLVADGA